MDISILLHSLMIILGILLSILYILEVKYFMSTKLNFIDLVENQSKTKVQIFRSDNAKEYTPIMCKLILM